jgi:hypothetical protein
MVGQVRLKSIIHKVRYELQLPANRLIARLTLT